MAEAEYALPDPEHADGPDYPGEVDEEETALELQDD